MTLNQTELLAAYTGLMILVRDDKEHYIKYISNLLDRDIDETELQTVSGEVSQLSDSIFNTKYESYNKEELAIVQHYTGVSVLKEKDMYYLSAVNNYSEAEIKIKFFRLCLPKSVKQKEKSKNITNYTIKDRSLKILEVIFSICIFTTLIVLFISTILMIINLVKNKENDYLGIILIDIVFLFFFIIAYSITTSKNNE